MDGTDCGEGYGIENALFIYYYNILLIKENVISFILIVIKCHIIS